MNEEDIFRAGFIAGFLLSAEGYNAEYPYRLFGYGDRDEDKLRECKQDIEEYVLKAFSKYKEVKND